MVKNIQINNIKNILNIEYNNNIYIRKINFYGKHVMDLIHV